MADSAISNKCQGSINVDAIIYPNKVKSGILRTGCWTALATGLTIAIAAFGGVLSQGKAAVAALEGIARNPGARKDLFVPFILALALIESLVIYALIIAFVLGGKIV